MSGPRELLAASKNLANYIQHSLLQENAPIWIAQREGRAKDGVDRTEPAVIKMLSLSRDKRAQEFGEHIQGLGIVPVAISYELDPCDALKANEMFEVATEGSYEKGEQEDVASIGQGIAGEKGRVHVSFGKPLGAGLDTPEAVAAEVDRQIIVEYCLHPTNLYAYRSCTVTMRPCRTISTWRRVIAARRSLRRASPPCRRRTGPMPWPFTPMPW